MWSRHLFLPLLAALPLLSACTSPAEDAERAARMEAADDADCRQLGFLPATSDYGDCRLRLREMRLKERIAQRPVYFDPYVGARYNYYP